MSKLHGTTIDNRLSDPFLQSRIESISRRYGPEAEDVRQGVALALLETAQRRPDFAEQKPGYWIKRAAWEARHIADKRRVYDRYVESEPYLADDDGEEVSALDESFAAPALAPGARPEAFSARPPHPGRPYGVFRQDALPPSRYGPKSCLRPVLAPSPFALPQGLWTYLGKPNAKYT